MDYVNVKPVICVSRCLGFDNCRWNGDTINDSFVNILKDFVEFHTICPESDIGLGIPRNPVRLIKGESEDDIYMIQPATGVDCTLKMIEYSQRILDKMDRVDGFLLKNASPSCGINNIKLYASAAKGSMIAKTSGLFAAAAQIKFPHAAFEDEGRLHNFILRENWLIDIFSIARFRALKEVRKIAALYDFHAQHKYLFMSYSHKKMQNLGHILANHDKSKLADIYQEYEKGLLELLALNPSIPRRINVLMHMFGYFSKELNPEERQYFLNILEEYRRGSMPFIVPIELIRNWALRFNSDYILKQIILQPYPKELLLLSDSGRGRNIKR
ncbi:MAG: DUF523 and DUF1722 domain-containing protein [Candidatus Stygibacter australis]|nr:DUF523 and DUF1722 domain-containing protein [Candidatus Stygibacter australis]